MTRRTPFTGTASSRRRARRVHLQREASLSVEVVRCPDPDHVTLQYKCPAAKRVDKAVETETEYHKQILAGASRYTLGDVDRGICLSGVAFYRAGHRRVRKDATHIVR